MSAARIFTTVLVSSVASFVAACSGYDGGGDVRIVPVADSGAVGLDGGRVPPLDDASPPRDSGFDSRIPTQGTLIAYYPLDGHVDDRSPSSSAPKRHLQLTNGSFTSGQVGSAFLMTSQGYAAERPQMDPELDFGDGDFTVQAWLSGSNAAVGFGTSALGQSTSDGWALYVTQGNVGWKTNDPRGILSQPLPASNAMRHVVARREARSLSIFVDGEIVATRDNTTPIGPQRQFAIYQSLNTSNTSSRVDEIVIWARALSDSEIEMLYARGQSGQPANPSD